MTKPRHVPQNQIDDARVAAIVASEQPVDLGRIVRAAKTMEEALAEMKYFCEPANAATIGRVEAVRYAWRTKFAFRARMLLLGIPCAIIGMTELMAQPWREGLPHAMEMLGAFGFMPALFGAIWLRHAWGERPGFPAYEVRAAPLLLTVGLGLMALGLFGAALGS